MFGAIAIWSIGAKGSIAALLGRPCDDDAYLARLIQQCARDMPRNAPTSGNETWWTCRALYQQLVGSWTDADEHRLTWIIYRCWRPTEIEGPNGWAYERRLTPEAIADLARYGALP